jgi:hypothetical protein
MAFCFHLFVAGYEERTLARRFGRAYLEYRRAVPRWIPRRPAASQAPASPARDNRNATLIVRRKAGRAAYPARTGA